MKTWATRIKSEGQNYGKAPATSSLHGMDPVGLALTLSKRMISIVKLKRIINIETSLEMVALAMTICSEVP